MSLQQISDTAGHQGFRIKVQAALYKAAVQVVGESTAAMSVAKASKRHTLGCSILSGGPLESFVRAVASQIGEVADPATILDATIESSISAVWDDMAGVTNTESQPV